MDHPCVIHHRLGSISGGICYRVGGRIKCPRNGGCTALHPRHVIRSKFYRGTYWVGRIFCLGKILGCGTTIRIMRMFLSLRGGGLVLSCVLFCIGGTACQEQCPNSCYSTASGGYSRSFHASSSTVTYYFALSGYIHTLMFWTCIL